MRQYLAWCLERDAEPLTRAALNRWVAGLLDGGAAAATARSRQLAVRRFASWLAEEGEIPADPFLGVKSPKLDERVVEPLTDDELRALLKACVPPKGATPAEALRHRRDEAIVRVMLETGTRAGEVVALELGDVDLINGALTVRRGKGGKGRVVPIGPEASLALDRYLRLRRAHRLAASPRPVARRPRQALLLRRPAQDAPRPRRRRRPRSASTRTSSATPPRTAGSPQAARSPG